MGINLKKSGELLRSGGRKEIIITEIIPSIGEKVTLLPHHKEELYQSGIDEGIIELNFCSISGESVVSFLNLSQIPGYDFKYGSVIFYGGWMCGNIFKPDKPREIKKKPNKYENPVDGDSSPVKLKLPEEIWQAIATKYSVEKPSDMDGWLWVEQNPQIPVVVCEGVKKAGCVISQTLTPAIALGGHTSACERDCGNIRFSEFLHPERNIIICFDNELSDIKASEVSKTIKRVYYRINSTSKDKKANKAIGAQAKLSIAHWHHPKKGIDDVWLSYGRIEVNRIISSAISCLQWVDTSFNKLGFEPNYQFNSAKWEWTDIPEDTRLVCLIGAKGTGKSWCLEQITLNAKNSKRPVITATHRIQLSMSLAGRLQIEFISDLTGKIDSTLQIALVIDSLPKINPKKFAGCIFILDEVVQMLDHFLLGETCAYKRQAILNTMRELCTQIVNSDGKLVIADADLNGTTIRFFSGLMGDEKPFIIQNTYRETSYTCHLSNGFFIRSAKGGSRATPADVVATALGKAVKGERIYIACSGQKEDSTWGSISLEGLFLAHGITSVIRIDSETIKNPEHPAFKATSKINEICDSYQIVIATPTLGTGVSIENRNRFDLVCGIFTGVGTPDSVRQALMRIRDKSVPRLIYCSGKGLNTKLASLGSTSNKVSEKVKELVEFQQLVLTEHDEVWSAEYPDIRYNQSASACFNAIVADKNKQNSAYKNYVRQGLKDENVTVIDVLEACEIYDYEDINPQEIYEIAKSITESKVKNYRAKILVQERLEAEEYEKLKSATELNETERIALEATALSNKYGGLKVTEELLEKDNKGWHEQIKLHYASTDGYEHLKNIQALISNTQLHRGEGELIEHDFMARNKILAQAEHIRATEIIDLIEGESVFSANDEESVSLCNDLIEQIPTINLVHEQNIKSSSYKTGEFNFKIIQLIGSLIDAKSNCLGQSRINGKVTRRYKLLFAEDNRQEIFELWERRDVETEKKWFKRKRDWEIKQLVAKIKPNVSSSEFEKIQQLELFNEAWEKVHTMDRIKIINQQEDYKIPQLNYKVITPQTPDYKNALVEIATWLKFTIDLETYGNDKKNKDGLHARKGCIRLIQVSNGFQTFIVDLGGRNSNREQIKQQHSEFLALLGDMISDSNRVTIGHNIHFDFRFLRFQLGFKPAQNVIDTMRGLQIFFGDYGGLGVLPSMLLPLQPGQKKAKRLSSNSLANGCEKMLGVSMDKEQQTSDWGADDLSKTQYGYAANDSHMTFHLCVRLEDLYVNPAKYGYGKLAQEDIRESWQLENDVIAAAIVLEENGMSIDINLANENLKKYKALQRNLLAEWRLTINGWNTNFDYHLLLATLNQLPLGEVLNDPSQISEKWYPNAIQQLLSVIAMLDTLGTAALTHKQPKLKDYLNQKYDLKLNKLTKDKHAELMHIPEIRLLGKLNGISTLVNQLEGLIRSSEATGRIQTNYRTNTGTGRFSSGDSKNFNDLPNLQSISAKFNPVLAEYNLPIIRSCVKPTGEPEYFIINRKDAIKQLKKYAALQVEQENQEYLDKAGHILRTLAEAPDELMSIGTCMWAADLLTWKENKAFTKKYNVADIRPLFKVLSKTTMVIVDLAASHGRSAADLAGDKLAIAGFNDDSVDNHSKVAVHVAEAVGQPNMNWEDIKNNKSESPYKGWRDTAKNTFYGWINCAGPARIQAQIMGNSGVTVSLESCKGAIAGCKTLYPDILAYRKWKLEHQAQPEQIITVDDKTYTINRIDRVNNRILHSVEVSSENIELPAAAIMAAIWSRIEATALKRALIDIIKLSQENPEWNLKPINYVHDEIDVECDTRYVKKVAIAVNNIIGDHFAACLTQTSDGRETNWVKLVVEDWSQK